MKSDYTDITLVVDRSGSMGSIVDDTIGGLNAFFEEQKKGTGTALATMVLFDDQYEFLHQAVYVQHVPPITNKEYWVRGSTALLDAVGRSIAEAGARLAAMPEPERPAKVLFVILTDGLENSSREFTRRQVAGMIKHQQETYSWDFLFLGAGIDAVSEYADLGIKAGNIVNTGRTNMAKKFRASSQSVNAYREASSADPAPDLAKDWQDTETE